MGIFAGLLAMAAPSFATWIQNMRLRTAAEAIQTGLQLARTEAVKRNTRVNLSLTTTTDNTCALSTSGPSWVISLGDPSNELPGQCGVTPTPDDESASAPRILQTRSSKDGSTNAVVTSDQSIISFVGTGKVGYISGVTPNPPVTVNIDITNPTGGTCFSAGGSMRCLRIIVTPAGQIRMCDPSRPGTDAQGC